MATTKITSPDLFNLESLNTALKLPSGTTAQRPTSPSTGEWRYNTTTNLVEFWDGGAWRDLQSEDIPPVNSENFNVVLYTGNGSTQSITGVGFKPDFVWIKDRSDSFGHRLIDSSTGPDKYLASNSTDVQQGAGGAGLTSFDSDGFSLGSGNAHNKSGDNFVAWCWKANAGTTSTNNEGNVTTTVQVNSKAGFSIIKTANSDFNVSRTFGHGLDGVPDLFIIKALSKTFEWRVYTSADSYAGFLQLDSDAAKTTVATNVTSTTFNTTWTPTGASYESEWIMYAFKEVAGFSKFGTYTGTGSTTNRPIINTGFEPAFVMIKNTTSADDWMIHDNKRNPSNPRDRYIRANTTDQEGQFAEFGLDFLTNGFIVGPTTNGNWNQSGQTYLYIAFASDPSAAPTLGDSFANKIYNGNGGTQSITGLGFSPSWVWAKRRSATEDHAWFDVVRGVERQISSNKTNGQNTTTNAISSFDTDGWTTAANNALNTSGQTYVAWNWKINPLPTINTDGAIQSIVSANQAAGISIVKWDGTGSASTVGHGLSSAPEIIFTKRLNGSGDWYSFSVFSNGGTTPANYFLKLNSSDGETLNSGSPPSVFAGTVPTATVFSVGTTLSGSTSDNYIAYCFTSVSGFSKMSSYTGNSSTQAITGLGFSPNWVLLKELDGVDSWEVYDTARGATSVLYPNGDNAEGNNSGLTSFDSDGFTLGSATSANESGKTYLYMAFKENPAQYAIPSGQMGYLVAAGGGGSSADSGGGAGAGGGGLRTTYGLASGGGASAETNLTLATGTYTITVGAGGAAYDGSTTSQNGVASTITGLASVSTVGGGAAGDFLKSGTAYKGNDGGSGGGSANSNGALTLAGGAGTANEGFAGGGGFPAGSGLDANAAGGGGGSAQVGVTATSGVGGNGGNGLTVAITGFNAGYAGGGGGGCRGTSGTTAGQGGDGGGGDAVSTGNGNPGAANTGGGAGGGRADGANGGSGVVILRMNTSDYSGTTTGSPTVTTVGSETILTYTGSGTYVHS